VLRIAWLPIRSCLCRESFSELSEAAGPAALRADHVARLLPALTVALKVAMFQFHARAIRRFRDEPHLNLTGIRKIGLDLQANRDLS